MIRVRDKMRVVGFMVFRFLSGGLFILGIEILANLDDKLHILALFPDILSFLKNKPAEKWQVAPINAAIR